LWADRNWQEYILLALVDTKTRRYYDYATTTTRPTTFVNFCPNFANVSSLAAVASFGSPSPKAPC